MPCRALYSHTFENKSSLPPTLFAPPPAPVVPPPPVLLVHPPNSSSADTLGCVTNPPDAPGTIEVFANDDPPMLPQPPKSLDDAAAGCGEGAFGAGSAHAFPPHTSAPPLIEASGPGTLVAAGAGWALGWVRLKGEFMDADAAGAGAGADGVEDEKSKRSFMAEEEGAAGLEGAAEEVMSPKPPKLLCTGAGLDAGAAAGLELKKPPPLRPEKALLCCGGGDLVLDMPPRPEKADVAGLLGLEMLLKLRLLKASLKLDWAG